MDPGSKQPSLVGRTTELARLRVALRGREGAPRAAIAIAGEPGIGKSRLLAELGELAGDSGHLVLAGRAAQFERDLPFAVFIDALDAYLLSHRARIEALGPERLTELARIFPSLIELAPEGRGGTPTERYRAHYAVRDLLDLLADRDPVLLALDDLQWADEASLELAAHLLRRPPSPAVSVALAYRSGEAPARLTAALDDAAREGRRELIELGPLSEDEVVELLPEQAGVETGARLYRESGGNPFYLEQLRGSLDQRLIPGGSTGLAAIEEDVPDAVAAALAGEVAALSAGARILLEGASVVGDPFRFELAAAAADRSERSGREALDELLTRGLAHPTEAPRRFRFRHPIVRKAVYAAAKAGWRLGAHARVREALKAQGAPASECAHHVERAAVSGDTDAIAVLERAGLESLELAPGAAAHWLGAALGLLPDSERARRLELLLPRATALGGSGRLRESREALLEALDLLPGGAEAERVTLVTSLAGIEMLLGLQAEAGERLRSALAAEPDSDSPGTTAFQCALSIAAVYDADWEEGRDRAGLAAEGAESGGAPALQATAEAVLSLASQGLGRISEGERHRQRAAALIEALDDPALGEGLDAVYFLGLSEYCLERYEDGARHLERGVAVSQLTKQDQLLITLKASRALCLVHLGHGPEAADLIEETIDAGRLDGNPQSVAWLLGVRGWIARLLGDLDLAVRSGERAVAIDAEHDESGVSHTLRAFLGSACAEAGEYERCLELMELAGAPEFPAFFSAQRAGCFESLSLAALGLGREQQAEAWATRAEQSAEDAGLPGALTAARRARARLLLAGDDPERAAEVALEAVPGLERQRARLDAARTRVLAGQALAGAGRAEAAIEELECAFTELDACGAVRYRDQAARELRRLGRRKPRSGRRAEGTNGAAGLSEREREIAELAARAKTNREIAAALYISEKTVEKHLSKVFAKLGIRGRVAIGSKLAAGGPELQK